MAGTLMPLWPPLLLLLLANGAPILAQRLLNERLDWALDGGRRFVDGRPLLGPAKSWRGLAASLLVTPLVAILLGLGWELGARLALLAMAGDAMASFTKRRLGVPPHGRVPLLDQLPEALLPLWLMRGELGLGWGQVLAVALAFMLVDMVLSPLLYQLRIRRRPY